MHMLGKFEIALILAVPTMLAFWHTLWKQRWNPRGKHCYITGGTAGLGLSLALLLTKRGAHVYVVARNIERLENARKEMEKVRQTPEQVLRVCSFSLAAADSSAAAFDMVCEEIGGKCPDAVFLCAGTSRPGFFVEETEESLRSGMDNAYWVQAWSALAAAKRMARDKFPGKIVFVSSILGYMSMIGYSSYSPAKFALRGLAETLRSELQLYSVSVHIFFPGTMYSPGYTEENKHKPKITLKIEESDQGMQPDEAAEHLFNGISRGEFHVTPDFASNVFRASTRGSTPHNNVLLDGLYEFIGWPALAIWRRGADDTVIKHRKEHQEYLVQKGFFSS